MSPDREPFTIAVCEALFGCHVFPGFDEDGSRIYRCAECDVPIDLTGWVHARHSPDCIINGVRDYLALHKPECVRSHGRDWQPAHTGDVKR